MSVKVAKFGGTSLADAGQFQKVRAILAADTSRQYIVPSAPGKRHPEDIKITDLLYLCHAQVSHRVPFTEIYRIIAQRYEQIASDLGVEKHLEGKLEEVREQIHAGASVDYVVSRGEYLNGLLLSAFLKVRFVDAAQVIRFKPDGTTDAAATRQAIRQHVDPSEQVVIPGFYGSMPDGSIKTFPRGGSDITGAVVAQAVDAAIYENWTDVSGFLVTDPAIVPQSQPIESITYRELRELSYMGAQVLHEETIFPVVEAGIPINIKNTNDPAHPGTMIVNQPDPEKPRGSITGIAGRKDFTVIAIEKNLMKRDLSFVRRLLTILEQMKIPIEHMPSGIDSLSLVIRTGELNGKLEALTEEIHLQCQPDLLEIHPNIALIATVGHGMAYTKGISARLFRSLFQAGVNVRMIDQGSSEINIIVGVENKDFEIGVEAIYRAFFSETPSSPTKND